MFSYAISSLLHLWNEPNITIGNKLLLIICYGAIFFLTVPRFFFGNLIFYNRTYKNFATGVFTTLRLVTCIIDFYWCLLEFLLFLFLGTLMIENPTGFIWGLLIISLIDVLWQGPKALFYIPDLETRRASRSWATINLFTSIACFLFLYSINWNPTNELLILAIIYTVACITDFVVNPTFYLRWGEKIDTAT